ncbi:hypothetical protein ACWD4V_13955 [Streptomyces tsukubensis]
MSARRPGEWPIAQQSGHLRGATEKAQPDEQGEQHLTLSAERARFHLVLGSVRADLEEQPSPACLRAAVRRWQAAITQIGDEVAARLRDTG